MKESVSAILIYKDEFFMIKRCENLSAFPGYYSFPGGKIDKADEAESLDVNGYAVQFNMPVGIFNGLVREIYEELGVSLISLIQNKTVQDISLLGEAITPDFNPHRFRNYYYKIFLSSKMPFVLDRGEILTGQWYKCSEAFSLYKSGHMLVVPPMISILEDLAANINSKTSIDPNLKYDGTLEVPMITPVSGLCQYLPLSNTFPPANRTNSFFIGDDYFVLIDPSPKDDAEFLKFKNTLVKNNHRPHLIFLTHHHPDHHQYSVDMAKFFSVPMGMSDDTFARLTKIFGKNYFEGIEIKFFKEGDILTKSNKLDIQILATPGHDEGQLTLLRSDSAWAIVSDLIQTVGTVVVGGEEGDMAKYFSSLERMIKVDPKVVVPSHGIAIGGTHKLSETLKHRREREMQVKELLDKGVKEQDMLALIYPELPERLHKYALATIHAHVRKLMGN